MAITINGDGSITGLSVGGLPDGTVDAGTVAADVATQAEIDNKLNLSGGNMTGNITTSTGSPLSYNLSSDYLIHKDAAQVVVTDNSSDGETWLTMKTFVAVKSGKLRFRWDAYIKSGTYYWAGEFHKNGTLMKKSDGTTDAHHSYEQSLASGFTNSVHNYRTFQMDLDDVLPGDVITYKMASSNSGGSIQSGSGQNLFCKNFEAYSSTPTIETHSATTEFVSVGTMDILGDDSAVALWKMDGNVDDAGGSYNGTNSGVTFATGKSGQAGEFSGSDSMTTSLSVQPPFSLSFWIKTSGLTARNAALFTFGNNTYITEGYGSSGGFSFHQPGVKEQSSTSGANENGSTWTHVVYTMASLTANTTNQKWYINGSQNSLSGGGQGGSFNSYSGNFAINAAINGAVDQVRIFNKVLSSSEVTTVYNEIS